MTDFFKTLLKFKGYGDPNKGVWFIGVEEAYQWKENPEQEPDKTLYERYAKGYFPLKSDEIVGERHRRREERKRPTPIYDVMSKIMVRPQHFSTPWRNVPWREYRNQHLLQAKSKTFQTNLYPLGKPSTASWPSHYAKLFGISRKEYSNIVYKKRFPMLHKFWRESHPSLTICFGKSFWPDFLKLFGLDKNQVEDWVEDRIYFQFAKSGCHLVLTPFFGRFIMSNDAIDQLVKEILRRGWKIGA